MKSLYFFMTKALFLILLIISSIMVLPSFEGGLFAEEGEEIRVQNNPPDSFNKIYETAEARYEDFWNLVVHRHTADEISLKISVDPEFYEKVEGVRKKFLESASQVFLEFQRLSGDEKVKVQDKVQSTTTELAFVLQVYSLRMISLFKSFRDFLDHEISALMEEEDLQTTESQGVLGGYFNWGWRYGLRNEALQKAKDKQSQIFSEFRKFLEESSVIEKELVYAVLKHKGDRQQMRALNEGGRIWAGLEKECYQLAEYHFMEGKRDWNADTATLLKAKELYELIAVVVRERIFYEQELNRFHQAEADSLSWGAAELDGGKQIFKSVQKTYNEHLGTLEQKRKEFSLLKERFLKDPETSQFLKETQETIDRVLGEFKPITQGIFANYFLTHTNKILGFTCLIFSKIAEIRYRLGISYSAAPYAQIEIDFLKGLAAGFDHDSNYHLKQAGVALNQNAFIPWLTEGCQPSVRTKCLDTTLFVEEAIGGLVYGFWDIGGELITGHPLVAGQKLAAAPLGLIADLSGVTYEGARTQLNQVVLFRLAEVSQLSGGWLGTSSEEVVYETQEGIDFLKREGFFYLPGDRYNPARTVLSTALSVGIFRIFLRPVALLRERGATYYLERVKLGEGGGKVKAFRKTYTPEQIQNMSNDLLLEELGLRNRSGRLSFINYDAMAETIRKILLQGLRNERGGSFAPRTFTPPDEPWRGGDGASQMDRLGFRPRPKVVFGTKHGVVSGEKVSTPSLSSPSFVRKVVPVNEPQGALVAVGTGKPLPSSFTLPESPILPLPRPRIPPAPEMAPLAPQRAKISLVKGATVNENRPLGKISSQKANSTPVWTGAPVEDDGTEHVEIIRWYKGNIIGRRIVRVKKGSTAGEIWKQIGYRDLREEIVGLRPEKESLSVLGVSPGAHSPQANQLNSPIAGGGALPYFTRSEKEKKDDNNKRSGKPSSGPKDSGNVVKKIISIPLTQPLKNALPPTWELHCRYEFTTNAKIVLQFETADTPQEFCNIVFVNEQAGKRLFFGVILKREIEQIAQAGPELLVMLSTMVQLTVTKFSAVGCGIHETTKKPYFRMIPNMEYQIGNTTHDIEFTIFGPEHLQMKPIGMTRKGLLGVSLPIVLDVRLPKASLQDEIIVHGLGGWTDPSSAIVIPAALRAMNFLGISYRHLRGVLLFDFAYNHRGHSDRFRLYEWKDKVNGLSLNTQTKEILLNIIEEIEDILKYSSSPESKVVKIILTSLFAAESDFEAFCKSFYPIYGADTLDELLEFLDYLENLIKNGHELSDSHLEKLGIDIQHVYRPESGLAAQVQTRVARIRQMTFEGLIKRKRFFSNEEFFLLVRDLIRPVVQFFSSEHKKDSFAWKSAVQRAIGNIPADRKLEGKAVSEEMKEQLRAIFRSPLFLRDYCDHEDIALRDGLRKSLEAFERGIRLFSTQNEIEQILNAIKPGNSTSLTDKECERLVTHVRELSTRVEQLALKASEADEQIDKLENKLKRARDAIQALLKEREHDELTDLVAKVWGGKKLNEEVARAERYGHPLSLIIVDMDYFRRVNNVFGHVAGDKVLKQFAKVLRKAVRETDVVCRYGGDEFLIILPATDKNGATVLAKKLRSYIEEYKFSSMQELPWRDKRASGIKETEMPSENITVSIGVASFSDLVLPDLKRPEPDKKSELLIRLADAALYWAKKKRNEVYAFDWLNLPSDIKGSFGDILRSTGTGSISAIHGRGATGASPLGKTKAPGSR